jgi:hypothetical protein
MEINWRIAQLESQKSNGLVGKIVYLCDVNLDGNFDRRRGEINLIGNENSLNFIPFENLTETIVLEWVKTYLGNTIVTEIETSLQNSVTAMKASKDSNPIATDIPWMK